MGSKELGDFLRARRTELNPSAVGLPGTGSRRRVHGLRRDEVAALASISTDQDFHRWWTAHHVAVRGAGTNAVRHPVVGDLTLDWSSLTCNADPDQQLFSWTAEPGSASDQALRAVNAGLRPRG